ncbi:tripartite tricarboxylate transporter substrate binding protein [Tissierella sp. Yu-01]|uniref:Bug family tripartite tricarboxylate transporter substrate binding protein n=1 Tax=Tissierella sp. Yu-01 TaxID=3035694 RepID=UPI00240DBF3A|nr:tripartite tricarboxylate transporter substrate binding protein [Tissierella sp. Yu-01]WFA07875.1 tripartite tricarboxylate transporter substrate binding protein [Tissierella sp. Yu-01]
MNRLLKILVLSLTITMVTGCEQAPASDSTFPSHDITGVVQWGAGGGTDSLMRPLASLAENILGESIVIQNKPGATGAIGTQYVHDQKADGYTLLMGAENPQLYKMLDISDLTYEDFEPVFLIGDERVGIIVKKDSEYTSFTDLINDALENPGKVNISTTGKGGMPWSVSSFIKAVTGAEFNQIPFDSDAACLTAVLGGHADFTVAKVQSGIQAYKAGDIKFLTLMSLNEVDVLPGVPIVTEEYPEFEKYLPWGSFYGVFVKDGTPQEVIDVMAEAFTEAYKEPSYQELLKGFNVNPLGITGEEAKKYLSNWQKSTAEAFHESGAIDKLPEELGIK